MHPVIIALSFDSTVSESFRYGTNIKSLNNPTQLYIYSQFIAPVQSIISLFPLSRWPNSVTHTHLYKIALHWPNMQWVTVWTQQGYFNVFWNTVGLFVFCAKNQELIHLRDQLVPNILSLLKYIFSDTILIKYYFWLTLPNSLYSVYISGFSQ